MCSSGSSLVIRWISRLLAVLPGTMTLAREKAPSRVSKCSLALRCFSSGPWHAKQFSARIGRMSTSKLIGRADAALSLVSAGACDRTVPESARPKQDAAARATQPGWC